MEPLTLCNRIDGRLISENSNLEKLYGILADNGKLPVAIISIIGEKSSGKTSTTNLLIQNLRNNSTHGWLEKVTLNSDKGRKVEPLPGFPLKEKTRETSDVSIWPEHFFMTNHGIKLMVLVLHVHYSKKDPRSQDVDSLEVFLSLISSKIVEIQWKKREFRYFGMYRDIVNHDEKFFDDLICNDVVYFLRSDTRPSDLKQGKAIDEEAAKTLRSLISCKSIKMKLEEVQRVAVAYIPDKKQSFKYSDGHLELSDFMYNAINNSINLVADDERLFPKIISRNNQLVGGDLMDYVKACIDITNVIIENHKLKQIFHPFVQETLKQKQCTQIDENGNETDDGNCSVSIADASIKNVDKEGDVIPEQTRVALPAATSEEPTQISAETATHQPVAVQDHEVMEEAIVCSSQEQSIPKNTQLLGLLVNKAHEILVSTLQNWEKNKSNFRCGDVLQNCVHSALQQIRELNMLQEDQRNELVIMTTKYLQDKNLVLLEVERLLYSFNVHMNATTSNCNALYVLVGFEELKKSVSERQDLNEYLQKFILDIGKTCMAKYINQHSSNDLFVTSLEHIKAFFGTEMQRYLNVGPYSRNVLKRLHSNLLHRCLSTLVEVMGSCTNIDLTQWRNLVGRFLLQKINPEMLKFKKANTSLLLKLQKRLTSVISKAKVRYDEIIVAEIIKKIPLPQLELVHLSARRDAVQYLQLQLNQNVRANEPVECHVLTLKALIDADWKLQKESYSFN
ncbi:unnamed protein product [Orchesella dallaii]|uniref:Uncharacterized protein n=1 Tax=Orchesella dallaii TaxID=48710 RepID=A0ABP1RQQ5_9HEXA